MDKYSLKNFPLFYKDRNLAKANIIALKIRFARPVIQ